MFRARMTAANGTHCRMVRAQDIPVSVTFVEGMPGTGAAELSATFRTGDKMVRTGDAPAAFTERTVVPAESAAAECASGNMHAAVKLPADIAMRAVSVAENVIGASFLVAFFHDASGTEGFAADGAR